MKKDDVYSMRIPKGDDREKGPAEIPEAVTTENFHKINSHTEHLSIILYSLPNSKITNLIKWVQKLECFSNDVPQSFISTPNQEQHSVIFIPVKSFYSF